MKRFLLLALLLFACQKGDPEGTIQPDAQGRTSNVALTVGDSPPFRLNGGDTTLTIFPAKSDLGADALASCEPEFVLTPYGAQEGRAVNTAGTFISVTRVNAIEPGVYFVRVSATAPFCRYTLFAGPAR